MSDPRGEGPSEPAGEPTRLEEVALEPGAVPEGRLAVRADLICVKPGDEVGGKVGEPLVTAGSRLGAEGTGAP
eukprot:6381161-Prorocentrum_lima.AAC.1